MRLFELIEECEETLLAHWTLSLAEGLAAPPRDHVSHERFMEFLTSLKAALAHEAFDAAASPIVEYRDEEESAHEGDPDARSATRAYGALHVRILAIAANRQVEVSLSEQLTLASYVNAAIGEAVAGQARTHDRKVHRLAHQLRNPLGSALMALTLLRARADLGEHARLGDMLERNLQRVQRLIDEAAGEGEPGSESGQATASASESHPTAERLP